MFVWGSKVLVNRGLITRGDTGIGMQRGIDHGNIVNDRRLRGPSSTGSVSRGSFVVSGQDVRSSSIVISSREWD